MTPDLLARAADYVADNARYHERLGPTSPAYVVRYPAAATHALMAEDTHTLTAMVAEVMAVDAMFSRLLTRSKP